MLGGCYELTDWEMFFQSSEGDLNVLNDPICSYISFVPTVSFQQNRSEINNRPWVTRELERCLNLKKMAFIPGDKERVKELQKELKHMTRLAKLCYKNKMEERFTRGNAREAWQRVNTLIRRTQRPAERRHPNPASSAEELNTFYARFNMSDAVDWTPANTSYTSAPVSVEERKVVSVQSRLHPRKAPGPDGLKGRILRERAAQLGRVVARLFQLLLAASFVPHAWKRTAIIPVSEELVFILGGSLDPLQFAYKAKRGVEDASLTLLDTVTKHLDSSNSLLMDFSSAFNTVNINTLLNRLQGLRVNTTMIKIKYIDKVCRRHGLGCLSGRWGFPQYIQAVCEHHGSLVQEQRTGA